MAACDDQDVAAVQRISAIPTILRVISQATGLRLAVVARVTDQMWKACAVLDRMNFGLAPGGELDIATTLCREVRESREPIVIDCASEDTVYCGHATPKSYGFESYISVPIVLRSGEYFGNLCALDAQPADLKSKDALSMFQLFAELISYQLESEALLETTQGELLDANETAKLREQFIAVLGHDIRTPLAAIASGVELLVKRDLGAPERQVLERMQRSTARISRLVDDVLDFARGRLGGGIPITKDEVRDLDLVFRQVVDEARSTYRARDIQLTINAALSVRCDRGRMGQMLANLLANALEHSPADTPVIVGVDFETSALVLRVVNQGPAITPAILGRLFSPFSRGATDKPRAGLGLGLYIVSQIAKSHGGSVEVSSLPDCTTFRVVIPRTAS